FDLYRELNHPADKHGGPSNFNVTSLAWNNITLDQFFWYKRGYIIEQDLVSGQESLKGSDPGQEMDEENQRIMLAISDNDEKKIIRREVEKKRRTKMSALGSSLRSSLPLELIKGKRSASDQIGVAVNYIQSLKQNISALQVKRDSLNQMIQTETKQDHSGEVVKSVNINLIPGGVEISICSGFEEGSSLSELMEILLQEGCDVVTSVSNHANGRVFHTINSQVEDMTRLDVAKLQHKLDHAILLPRTTIQFAFVHLNFCLSLIFLFLYPNAPVFNLTYIVER
ncbi:unnamed protein product, partial [Sphenostylis stenocarpa]